MTEMRDVPEASLRALSEDVPYVLVGTSGAGVLVAGFAYAHAKDVVGMVLGETPRALITERATLRGTGNAATMSPYDHADLRVHAASWPLTTADSEES